MAVPARQAVRVAKMGARQRGIRAALRRGCRKGRRACLRRCHSVVAKSRRDMRALSCPRPPPRVATLLMTMLMPARLRHMSSRWLLPRRTPTHAARRGVTRRASSICCASPPSPPPRHAPYAYRRWKARARARAIERRHNIHADITARCRREGMKRYDALR